MFVQNIPLIKGEILHNMQIFALARFKILHGNQQPMTNTNLAKLGQNCNYFGSGFILLNIVKKISFKRQCVNSRSKQHKTQTEKVKQPRTEFK